VTTAARREQPRSGVARRMAKIVGVGRTCDPVQVKKNGVDPQMVVDDEFGDDTARFSLMFAERRNKRWNGRMKGAGAFRFIKDCGKAV